MVLAAAAVTAVALSLPPRRCSASAAGGDVARNSNGSSGSCSTGDLASSATSTSCSRRIGDAASAARRAPTTEVARPLGPLAAPRDFRSRQIVIAVLSSTKCCCSRWSPLRATATEARYQLLRPRSRPQMLAAATSGRLVEYTGAKGTSFGVVAVDRSASALSWCATARTKRAWCRSVISSSSCPESPAPQVGRRGASAAADRRSNSAADDLELLHETLEGAAVPLEEVAALLFDDASSLRCYAAWRLLDSPRGRALFKSEAKRRLGRAARRRRGGRAAEATRRRRGGGGGARGAARESTRARPTARRRSISRRRMRRRAADFRHWNGSAAAATTSAATGAATTTTPPTTALGGEGVLKTLGRKARASARCSCGSACGTSTRTCS